MAQDAIQKAAAYIRVSQERAARNGYGLGAQETDVVRYAAYKELDLVETYREEGVSGYKKERPALDRLLADARAGRFQTVIFPSIDRAGRSVRDVIEIDQALRAAGVATVFLREGVDTSTATGQLFRNIMASLAEFEGRIICERLSKGRRRKAAEGGYVGGWLPYGYRRGEDGKVAEVPEQVTVLRQIFGWAGEGRTLRWIAGQLAAAGVATRNGGEWRSSTIARILGNRYYAGRVAAVGA
jgi:site-specific DNA recombinase